MQIGFLNTPVNSRTGCWKKISKFDWVIVDEGQDFLDEEIENLSLLQKMVGTMEISSSL